MGPAKYQIFISSTFEDLRKEREQVIRAVLEMGHIPVGMEMFSAADEEQWRIISRYIDESDYYVIIAAHRLGSLTPEGISYTRKEYEYARMKNTPCLGFLIDEATPWSPENMETEQQRVEALSSFKALIREKPVGFWTSPEDLHSKVSIALMKAFTAQPRSGWVRASSIVGPEVMTELSRLSSENATLRAQLNDQERATEREHREEKSRMIQTLFNTNRTLSYRYSNSRDWHDDAEISLFAVFTHVAPELMVESSIADLSVTVAMYLRTDKKRQWGAVAHNQMKTVMIDFMTLGIAQPSSRKHPVSDSNEYWTLSPLGIEIVKQISRTQLTELPPAEDVEDADGDAPSSADGDQTLEGETVVDP